MLPQKINATSDTTKSGMPPRGPGRGRSILLTQGCGFEEFTLPDFTELTPDDLLKLFETVLTERGFDDGSQFAILDLVKKRDPVD